MYRTEITFIKAIKEKNYERAKDVFDNIFDELVKNYSDDHRQIKNYLITLNGMLYRSYKSGDEKLADVYAKRSELNFSFENSEDIVLLRSFGQNMVDYYMELFNGKVSKTTNNTVNEALTYMNRHLHEDLSLSTVANEIHISKSYLSSLLAKHTRSSFPELLTEMRVNTAKNLLKNTNISILDVSNKCGYNSQSYFCSTFKKQTGYTPTNFRENKHKL